MEYKYQRYTREHEGEMLRIFNQLPHEKKEYIYNWIKYAKHKEDEEKAAAIDKEFEGYKIKKGGL